MDRGSDARSDSTGRQGKAPGVGWAGRLIAILPALTLWLGVLLIARFDFGWGMQRGALYLAVLAVLAILPPPNARAAGGARLRAASLVACLLLAGWHVSVLATESPKRVEIDVASTTIAAGDLMFQGKNPYRIPIDYRPEITAPVNTYGYKYGPLMAAAYRPFVLIFDENGVRVANLLLVVLTTWAAAAMARCLAGSGAALIAAPLFLSFPSLPALLYVEPFNDLVAVLPIGAACLMVGSRPFLAGLLTGASIAAKLLPGALFVPFLFPPGSRARLWFLAGLAAGCTPLAAYALWSPPDLVGNLFTFTALRQVDTSSWMYGLPAWLPDVVKVVVALLVAAGAAFAFWPGRRTKLRERLLLAVACTILVTLAGFGVRRNYVLWWLPFATALVAADCAARLATPVPDGAGRQRPPE